jgi:hypothetical protein
MFSNNTHVRIEAFDTPLRGRRTLVLGPPATWLARLGLLESESLYKGRSILVIHEGRETPSPLLFKKRWDCIFRVKDPFEYQMVATYAANAPKPVRILWTSMDPTGTTSEIPRGLWQRWTVSSDVTLLGGTETVLGCEWESILFPLQCPHDTIERMLGMRGASSLAVRFRDYMTEIHTSKAALAWTLIQESDSKGALYWYDPADGVRTRELYPKKEAGILLESLAKWVSEGGGS